MTARPAACVFQGVILSLSLLIFGCASEPAKPHHAKLDPAEEKMITLTQQVEDQSVQIQGLKAAVDALLTRVRRSESDKERKLPSPGVTKSESEGTEENGGEVGGGEPDEANGASPIVEAPPVAQHSEAVEGATVADSKHEAMHYYYSGLQSLEEHRYEEALKSFRAFLKAAPTHVYADRAEYLIAKTHFLNREYGLVVVETNLLESRYPYSFKIPAAIWHRALAYVGMNQPDGAKQTLRDLMNKYPNTTFAERASRKLAELGKSNHSPPQLMLNEKD